MLIECETCPVAERHCGECMVTAMLQLAAPEPAPCPTPTVPKRSDRHEPYEAFLDPGERRAVDLLATAGLISAREATAARAWCRPMGPLPMSG